MFVQNGYADLVEGLDLYRVTALDDVVYVIDEDFRLRAVNAAWHLFARRNGADHLPRDYPLGCRVLDAFCDDAVEFFVPLCRHVLTTGQRFDHDYRCDTPFAQRRFRQSVYPVPAGAGLLVSNHLLVSRPHTGPFTAPAPRHRDSQGRVRQCAHCRRVRDNSGEEKWDWVPALVDAPAPGTVHVYCPLCADLHQPPVLPAGSAC